MLAHNRLASRRLPSPRSDASLLPEYQGIQKSVIPFRQELSSFEVDAFYLHHFYIQNIRTSVEKASLKLDLPHLGHIWFVTVLLFVIACLLFLSRSLGGRHCCSIAPVTRHAESQNLLIAPAQQRSTFLPRSLPPLLSSAYDVAERSCPVPALPCPSLRCAAAVSRAFPLPSSNHSFPFTEPKTNPKFTNSPGTNTIHLLRRSLIRRSVETVHGTCAGPLPVASD